MSILGFGCILNVGYERQCELGNADCDSIRGHSCRIQLHQLHVDTDLFLEVEGVVDYLQQLLQHVGCGWSIGAINGCCHHYKEHVVVDALVVAAAGCSYDCISDVAANQFCHGLNYAFLCANEQLIDHIQMVGFLLCL